MPPVFRALSPLLLTALLLNMGCKKYAEDRQRYLKTPCERIAKEWELYSITDRDGREFKDSVVTYKSPNNKWALNPEQRFTYNGLVIAFQRSSNKMCLETGIDGKATVTNKPFGEGRYSLKHKRVYLEMDVSPYPNATPRYFFGLYKILKLTPSELIIDNNSSRVRFKAVN